MIFFQKEFIINYEVKILFFLFNLRINRINCKLLNLLINLALSNNKKLSVSFRIWFFSGDEKLLGKGRVELLQKIDELGSISNAAKSMKMSYRQAWQMVEEMNDRAKIPLVEKKLGGKSGGGAVITNAGKNTIKLFNDFENKVAQFIKEESKLLSI
ncbi:MAG: LysR family transcriptional regulator [Bacteroidia bacterium]|nr:LysR family transcriptional regulator [Bacteroidia bacterium]